MSTLMQGVLEVRPMASDDVPAVAGLSAGLGPTRRLTPDLVRGLLRRFPEGQFVASLEGQVVGFCTALRIDEPTARRPHTWREITGGGAASRHDPDGDVLYGTALMVADEKADLAIEERLDDARRALARELGLKGVMLALPIAPTDEDETAEVLMDRATRVHLREADYVVLGRLDNFLRSGDSAGTQAWQIFWENPVYEAPAHHGGDGGRATGEIRVAAVQFQARRVDSFDQFMGQVEYFIDVAADYRSDFILFPELFTMPLVSAEEGAVPPEEAVRRVASHTEQFVERMRTLALSYNVNIIGGSHVTEMEGGEIENICYVFLRDGSVHAQSKLHPTPSERNWWKIKGGHGLSAIDTDCGPIGVLICYDSEFPEAARQLADQGALILFVPFCTDERQGYQRVRICSHARAIENQMYVVLAGMVGNLPDVENMDIHYAESCILTPCDFPFARDGIAAAAAPNTEMIVFSDLRLESLLESRRSGTVQNLRDRRFDLYEVNWRSGQGE